MLSALPSKRVTVAMRHLYLLRHAKSAWPQGVEDHERPLAKRGREAAPLMGARMKAEGYRPDRVLVSTALRTRETFAHVAEKRDMPAPIVTRTIYGASADVLLALVQATDDAVRSLMIIGHNPGMADLSAALTDSATSDRDAMARLALKYPTAALSVFAVDAAHWAMVAPQMLRLAAFITPHMLGGVDED